jgi:DNA-directed RNA polymerase specialized sigma subunit
MSRGDDESVREKLKNYRAIVLKYEAYQMVYDQLYPRMTSILTDMPKGYSEDSALEKLVQRRMDLCDKITEVLMEMRERLDEIILMIGELKDNEQVVIIFRYVQGMSWNKIARRMTYSVDNCYKIHSRAIERMDLRRSYGRTH